MLLRRSADALAVGCDGAGNAPPAKAGSEKAHGFHAQDRAHIGALCIWSAANWPGARSRALDANRSAAGGATPTSTARGSAGPSEATRPTRETTCPTDSGQARTRAGG